MSNIYTFGIHEQLEPQELFFLVFCRHRSTTLRRRRRYGIGSNYCRLPYASYSGKFGGATKGTSIASVVSRRALPFELKYKILPTITWKSMLQLKVLFVKNIGTFVGRSIPVIGVFMLAYDAYRISTESLRAYNAIAKEEDRVF